MKKLFASFIALCFFVLTCPVFAQDNITEVNEEEEVEVQTTESRATFGNLENVEVVECTSEAEIKEVSEIEDKKVEDEKVEAEADKKSAAVEKEAVVAPKWEDYVPEKYQNPRGDFRRSTAITELVFGVILTDFIFTAPIGIPMICHSTTKLKNISYYEKKEKFFKSMEVAEDIKDPQKKQAYYERVLKQCKMTEKKKQKLAKKRAKKAAKAKA